MDQHFSLFPEYHFPLHFIFSDIRLYPSVGSSVLSLTAAPKGPSATYISLALCFLNQELIKKRRMCQHHFRCAASTSGMGCLYCQKKKKKTSIAEKHCRGIKYMGGLWAIQERHAAIDKSETLFVCSPALSVLKESFATSQLAVVYSWYLTFSVWLLCIC